jgi:hypothetical protein
VEGGEFHYAGKDEDVGPLPADKVVNKEEVDNMVNPSSQKVDAIAVPVTSDNKIPINTQQHRTR